MSLSSESHSQMMIPQSQSFPGILTGNQGHHLVGMLSNVEVFHVKGHYGQIYSV